jgi:cysteine desulfurase
VILRETYLDWNATAPLRPEAAAAMRDAMEHWGNPSSVHRRGRAARRAVEAARDQIAALCPGDVTFTSGGTEANHLALFGTGRKRVLVSAIEHGSVLQAVLEAERIPVDGNGIVDLAALDRLLADGPPALVSVMLANNETGVIQPLAQIVAIAHARGALVHTDAVQAAGRIALDVGADVLTLSAHKIGGPQGIGAVVSRVELAPLIRGGGQERGRRAGTENLVGIAGFAAAVEAALSVEHSLGKGEVDRVRSLRDRLEAALPGAVIVGAEAPRLPNTSAVGMPGMPAETQVIAFDLAGVMVSAGAACSSGKVGPSHVLAAMGLDPGIADSTIRVSLGWTTTEADIDHFIDTWAALRTRRDRRRAA